MKERKKMTGNLKRALESQTDKLHFQKMHTTMECLRSGDSVGEKNSELSHSVTTPTQCIFSNKGTHNHTILGVGQLPLHSSKFSCICILIKSIFEQLHKHISHVAANRVQICQWTVKHNKAQASDSETSQFSTNMWTEIVVQNDIT